MKCYVTSNFKLQRKGPKTAGGMENAGKPVKVAQFAK